jgi:hypothetical protein
MYQGPRNVSYGKMYRTGHLVILLEAATVPIYNPVILGVRGRVPTQKQIL